jgi:integrase
MPKTLEKALSAKTLSRLTAPGTYADGNGLSLRIDDKGYRRWIWRGQVNGKSLVRGLGGYPAVPLAEARKAAARVRADAKAGQLEGAPPAPEPAPTVHTVPTFSEASAAVIALRKPTWKNWKHGAQWVRTLNQYVVPTIGDMPVDEITAADVLDVLEPIWTEKPETASRVRQRMETVMDWCVGHGHRQDNPAGRHILKILPSTKRMKAHHKALSHADVPATLRKVGLSTCYPLTKLAFRLLVLTATRSGEVRNTDWSEIDWESATWTIPGERMKAGKEHRIPLSDKAMDTLRDAWGISGPDGLLFPAPRTGKALSDMALTQLLRRLDIPSTVHGFRSSFRDWAAEQSGASWAVCESALAHTIGNGVEQAYMRSDLFDKRRDLMQAWADYVTG